MATSPLLPGDAFTGAQYHGLLNLAYRVGLHIGNLDPSGFGIQTEDRKAYLYAGLASGAIAHVNHRNLVLT